MHGRTAQAAERLCAEEARHAATGSILACCVGRDGELTTRVKLPNEKPSSPISGHPRRSERSDEVFEFEPLYETHEAAFSQDEELLGDDGQDLDVDAVEPSRKGV